MVTSVVTEDSQKSVHSAAISVHGPHLSWKRTRRPSLPRAALLLAVALTGIWLAACGSVAKPQGWAAPTSQGDTLYLSLEHGRLVGVRLGDTPARVLDFPKKDEKFPLVVEKGKDLSAPKETKLKLEGFYGNPLVTDDSVYLTAYSGHVLAVSKDGRTRWAAQLPGRLIGGVQVQGGLVVTGTTSRELFALAADTGKIAWRASLPGEVWSTPAVMGDSLIVSTTGGYVVAMDATGHERWRSRPTQAAIAVAPLVVGDRVFVGSFDRYLYALDAKTGAVQWKSSRTADNWLWSDLLLQGETLYAGSLSGTMYAVRATSGEITWSVKLGDTIRSRPAVVDGVLVAATLDGRLHGLKPDSGERVWETNQSPAPDDPGAARNKLYADLLPATALQGVYAVTEGGNKNAGQLYFLDVGQRKVSAITVP